MLGWVLVGISTFQAISTVARMGSGFKSVYPLWVSPLSNLCIVGLMYWPFVRGKTGKFFVPLLVVLITISSILNTYLSSMTRLAPSPNISIVVEGNQNLTIPFELSELMLIMASWQLIPLLFIPLIMVAWQYGFKAVIRYITFSTLLDALVFFSFVNTNEVFVALISVFGILMTRTFTYLVAGFLVTRMMAAQREQREELRQANQQLLGYAMTQEQLATSRERNRLAREMHDTVAHTLSGLAVQLGAIKALWKKEPANAEAKLDDAIQTTRDGLNETRRALQALRAAPLEDLGLALALQSLAKSASERCGAALTVDIPITSLELAPNISQAFYRAGQEILENIARHAEADHITLRLTLVNHVLTLQITDNGIGFNPEASEQDTYGLRGLEERADLIGGEVVIDSQPGQGTTVTFSAGV